MCDSKQGQPYPGNQRWLVPVALHVCILIAYLNRLNISVALPAMSAEFGWSVSESGANGGRLMAVFYIGYAAANFLLGGPAARFGARRSLLWTLFLFSLCTMACGVAANSFILFVILRFLLGIAQGPLFPLVTTLTQRWFPVHERSRANGIYIGGMLLAPLLAPVLLTPLTIACGWRGMLFVVGVGSLIVAWPPTWKFIYNAPSKAPYLSARETRYIESGLEPQILYENDWRFLRDIKFWLAAIIAVLNNFTVFGVMFWLPIYFTESRNLPFANITYAASLPYLIGISGIAVMAWAGDKFNRRVLLAGTSYMATAICVYAAASSIGILGTILWFAAAVFFQFGYGAQEFAILQRILPHSSVSRGTGIYNGIAVLGGGLLSSEGIGKLVEFSGSYTVGLGSVVIGAVMTGILLLVLSRLLKY